MPSVLSSISSLLLVVASCRQSVEAFSASSNRRQLVSHQICNSALFASRDDGNNSDEDDNSRPIQNNNNSQINRREALRSALTGAALATSSTLITQPSTADALSLPNPFTPAYTQSNNGRYIPGKRCTAYLVDTTIPPSLIPYRASREAAILKNLGMGYGTSKAPFIEDDITLNNMMNKAVFGSISAVNNAVGGEGADLERKGENYQSFIFLGANFDDTFTAAAAGEEGGDAQLAVGLLEDICKPKERIGNTAIGLSFCPQGCQELLDQYVNGGSESALLEGLKGKGVDEQLTMAHLPILRFAQKKRFSLLALAPESQDLDTVRKGGLQSLDPEKRETYVADAQGFIALTQDPRFKLYTEKSLFKDFRPSSAAVASDEAAAKAEQGNYFAEKILVHEACATCISKWAASRPNALVVTIAPIPDVRFLGGINGRVPRISQFLNKDSLVDDEAVTTILLNPNAKETLSESKWLRLEIGTSPGNWAYQTKVADYLWFSSMPKVNMLPRMMNEQ
mmetsp:Transcript_11953/g.17846  ORF Transcript_11953/g.17846 Transcript_11953/m.17846 type:complete len:510 (+) Transcript_11953:67-1596(+)